ncbi:MAG: hypothetical protein LBH24_05735 [Clostridiales bacterium]|jgi:hypothetical protein|nr:hypothetical protein [Clostridiales bacterium]
MKGKAGTFIGFAVKAGRVLYGVESIERYKRAKYLILTCPTLAENSRKRLMAKIEGIPVIQPKNETLSALLHRENCKAAALTDRELAQAVLKYLDDGFQRMTEVR